MKVVINRCYGGFGLSHEAYLRLRELEQVDALEEPDEGEYYSDGSGPRKYAHSFCTDVPRDDLLLVQVVKELGEAANGECAALEIVEIPDGTEWQIGYYGGMEWVAEKHETWS
jgi:hypothetical protein